MSTSKTRHWSQAAVLGVMAVVLAVALACAAPEPTATPIPPAPPAPPEAPAPVATATPVVAPVATPTPTQVPVRLLPTPTPGPAPGQSVHGGTLRYTEFTFTTGTLDPAYVFETEARRPMFAIYDHLVALAPDAAIVPKLAESWSVSPDGKEITFQLRKGVKFHDGTDFNARAIKAHFDRIRDPAVGSPPGAAILELQRTEVAEDLTVRLILSKPFRPFLAEVADLAGMIESPTAVERLNSYAVRTGDFGQKPVGTGPFKFKEWSPGIRIVLERNENYWDKGKPYLDAILFQVVPDATARFAMLRTNETDFLERVPVENALQSRGIPGLRVADLKGARYRHMYLRVSVKPFNNKAFRAALAFAMDRQRLNDILERGTGVPAYSPTGPALGVWYDPTIEIYKYDPVRAREKLAEAGYPAGASITMGCGSGAVEIFLCETHQAVFKEVGIRVEIKLFESSVTAMQDRRTDIISTAFSARSDPHVNLFRWYHTNGGSKLAYNTDYSNLEYDRLIEEAATIYDLAKAKELYSKAERILAEDAQSIFILHQTLFFIMKDKVGGFQARMDAVPRLAELWLSK